VLIETDYPSQEPLCCPLQMYCRRSAEQCRLARLLKSMAAPRNAPMVLARPGVCAPGVGPPVGLATDGGNRHIPSAAKEPSDLDAIAPMSRRSSATSSAADGAMSVSGAPTARGFRAQPDHHSARPSMAKWNLYSKLPPRWAAHGRYGSAGMSRSSRSPRFLLASPPGLLAGRLTR